MTKNQNKKSKIPYLFFLFFAVIFTVDGIYIYLAKKTWRGLATEDGYKKGLEYDRTIELVKKQEELGWYSEIRFERVDVNQGILSFKFIDDKKNSIKNAKVIAKINRPVQEGYEFEETLKFDSKFSLYLAKINFPLKGQWSVEIEAVIGDVIYQDVKRIVVW